MIPVVGTQSDSGCSRLLLLFLVGLWGLLSEGPPERDLHPDQMLDHLSWQFYSELPKDVWVLYRLHQKNQHLNKAPGMILLSGGSAPFRAGVLQCWRVSISQVLAFSVYNLQYFKSWNWQRFQLFLFVAPCSWEAILLALELQKKSSDRSADLVKLLKFIDSNRVFLSVLCLHLLIDQSELYGVQTAMETQNTVGALVHRDPELWMFSWRPLEETDLTGTLRSRGSSGLQSFHQWSVLLEFLLWAQIQKDIPDLLLSAFKYSFSF